MAQMLKRESMGFDNRHYNRPGTVIFCARVDSTIADEHLLTLSLSVIICTRQRCGFLPTPAFDQRVLHDA